MNSLNSKFEKQTNPSKNAYETFDYGQKDLEPISTFRQAAPQFIAVGLENILLFVFGMGLGFPTIVIPAIQGGEGTHHKTNDIILNKDQISWFSSINLLCVPIGCFLSGLLTQPIGKRRTMQLINISLIISWLLFHFGPSIEYLYAGLCIQGLSGGVMETPVLTYIAEITQPKYRGILAASGSIFVVLGVFVQFVLGSLLSWRRIAAISILFSVLSFLLLFFVPESPIWLIQQNRFREAIKSLQWLRGWVPEKYVENEFNALYDQLILKNSQRKDMKSKCINKFGLFKKSSFLKPFFLILLAFFIAHFSGKTALQTYAVQIFHTLKAPINKYYATVLLGLCELISTILCVVLIHFTGKRPLVFVSLIGCGLCFFGTATYAYFIDDLPGYGINNIVSNASLIISKKDIISTDNIRKIFQDPQLSKFDIVPTTFLSIDLTTMNSISSRSEQDLHQNDDETTLINTILDINVVIDNTVLETFDSVENSNVSENYGTTINNEDINTTQKYHNENFIEKTTITNDILESNQNKIKNLKSSIIIAIPKQETSLLYWMPLILLLSATFFAHLGIRILPWVLIGEIFPSDIRNEASGIAGAVGYTLGFCANKLFLQMLASLTMPGTFWFNSSIALFGSIILYLVLPETEGKTLNEIEECFAKKPSINNNKSEVHTNILPNDTVPLPIGLLEIPIRNKYILKSIETDLKENNLENGKVFYPIYGKYNLAYEDERPVKQITYF